MHAAAWTVIALESLATGVGSHSAVIHLPRANLLQQSWIVYGAMGVGIISVLAAVFVWSERSTFGAVWKLTPSGDHSLFWGELKFNAIGVSLVLALSLASLAANKRVLAYLHRLPEGGFIRIVFAESRVQLSTYQFRDYFTPDPPKKWRTRVDRDRPNTKPGHAEETPPGKRDDRASSEDFETTMNRHFERLRAIQAWKEHLRVPEDQDLVHMIFPFHIAFSILFYLMLCRRLTARHKVMAA